MRSLILGCALLTIYSPAAISEESSARILSLPEAQAWTGDLNGMVKRRTIRILVVPSKTFFFLSKGDTLGLIAETGQEFEKWINKRRAKPPYNIKVQFVPTRRDRILQDLIDGKGDIAAANLTITVGRSALVDFPKPWLTGVKEILVTGPSAPSVATLADLGGKDVMVRVSSSYYGHLVDLNDRLKKENRTPITIVPADESLEDEDLLEMVSAGLLPWAIVDSHKAKLWARILKGLAVREDIAFNQGGEISWAIRKTVLDFAVRSKNLLAPIANLSKILCLNTFTREMSSEMR
jgi:membrane-bound lytic murein transglycosylase MltF